MAIWAIVLSRVTFCLAEYISHTTPPHRRLLFAVVVVVGVVVALILVVVLVLLSLLLLLLLLHMISPTNAKNGVEGQTEMPKNRVEGQTGWNDNCMALRIGGHTTVAMVGGPVALVATPNRCVPHFVIDFARHVHGRA